MERLEQEGSDDDGNKNSIDDALRRAGGLAPDFMKCLVRERHRGRGWRLELPFDSSEDNDR